MAARQGRALDIALATRSMAAVASSSTVGPTFAGAAGPVLASALRGSTRIRTLVW